jgi:hypothetical protein
MNSLNELNLLSIEELYQLKDNVKSAIYKKENDFNFRKLEILNLIDSFFPQITTTENILDKISNKLNLIHYNDENEDDDWYCYESGNTQKCIYNINDKNLITKHIIHGSKHTNTCHYFLIFENMKISFSYGDYVDYVDYNFYNECNMFDILLSEFDIPNNIHSIFCLFVMLFYNLDFFENEKCIEQLQEYIEDFYKEEFPNTSSEIPKTPPKLYRQNAKENDQEN